VRTFFGQEVEGTYFIRCVLQKFYQIVWKLWCICTEKRMGWGSAGILRTRGGDLGVDFSRRLLWFSDVFIL